MGLFFFFPYRREENDATLMAERKCLLYFEVTFMVMVIGKAQIVGAANCGVGIEDETNKMQCVI